MRTGGPGTALQAVAWRRLPASSWPWRSAGYLITTLPAALAAAVPLGVASLPWAVFLLHAGPGPGRPGLLVLLILLGAALAAVLLPLAALPLAGLERRRLRMADPRPCPSGHQPPPASGPLPWLRTRYGEAATWREAGYTCLLATAAPALAISVLLAVALTGGLIASPFLVSGSTTPVSLAFGKVSTVGQALPYAIVGVLLLPLLPYLLTLCAGGLAAVARALLQGGPGEHLRAELVQVSRSRARLADAFEAERRRIERDLHDGAQQRLVSLTLQLGIARLDIPPESPAARTVASAHEQAKQLMAELRQLIHGIQPQILADSGLPAALGELADQSAVPVTVSGGLTGRLPAQIEATAYFVVAEAITNIAKHSRATKAAVTVAERDGMLAVEVSDNGHGGADPGRGTGLTGLADRVAVVDGRMLLSSPSGGPTLLRVELPCSQHRPPSG
jgi:signal transduction histidine kinase